MTSQFIPGSNDQLAGSVVVLTGGASGICAELTRLCHRHGAHVYFGDVLQADGDAVENELKSSGGPGSATFVKTDVSSYADNLKLFDTAFKAHGRVDHAVSGAGISERGNITDPTLTLETVRDEPKWTMTGLDVNLVGPIYFSRIASVYLRQSNTQVQGATSRNRSLTLVSSVAGFTEAPGLAIYSAAKHGVIGLMRALRPILIAQPVPIRTNAICPWFTRTRMVHGVQDDWAKAGLPVNEPMDVAKIIAGVMVDGKINGQSLYVEGGRAWDVEEGLDKTQPQWMGDERTRVWLKGQDVLGTGDNWQKKH